MAESPGGDDVLPTAVRVWAVRTSPDQTDDTEEQAGSSSGRTRQRRYPAEALVFDTETRDETNQRLLLGVWRLYRDTPDSKRSGHTCIEEGFFYPDDLPEVDPAGWQQLQNYVAGQQADVAPGFPPELQCVPLSWWLEHRLYRYGFKHRNRCAIVGFNLPFDFGALAQHWSPAGRRYRGGWSLGLWGEFDEHGRWHDQLHHPRLLLRAIDPRRTLFGWGSTGTKTRRAGSTPAPATSEDADCADTDASSISARWCSPSPTAPTPWSQPAGRSATRTTSRTSPTASSTSGCCTTPAKTCGTPPPCTATA